MWAIFKRLKLETKDTKDKATTESSDVVENGKYYTPLYLMSVWQKPGTTKKRITVANILPSALGAGNVEKGS